jgi:hypothetical protein
MEDLGREMASKGYFQKEIKVTVDDKPADPMAFITKAREIVRDHYNEELALTSAGHEILALDDIFVVWFCKTLQNWKALLSTTRPDTRYYEVTYNGWEKVAYLDVYVKERNREIADPLAEVEESFRRSYRIPYDPG